MTEPTPWIPAHDMAIITGIPESVLRRQALVLGAWREGQDFRLVRGTLEIHAAAFERWANEQEAPAAAPIQPKPRRKPVNPGCTRLYRHFDAAGQLLYVGISLRIMHRLQQHLGASSWADEIARVEITIFSTRADALAAEKLAIQAEAPVHNIVHAQKP